VCLNEIFPTLDGLIIWYFISIDLRGMVLFSKAVKSECNLLRVEAAIVGDMQKFVGVEDLFITFFLFFVVMLLNYVVCFDQPFCEETHDHKFYEPAAVAQVYALFLIAARVHEEGEADENYATLYGKDAVQENFIVLHHDSVESI